MTHRAVAALLAAFALTAACGGGQPEVTQPTNPVPSASAAPTDTTALPTASATASAAPPASAAPTADTSAPPGPPGPGDWDKWSHDQKMAYMKTTVMPKMGALFHDFDAKTYADPKCGLCHGPGVKDGSFKMPNPDLPKLDIEKLMKGDKGKHPKVTDFMMKQVKPQMAAMLGEPEMDPKTGKGFGCLECHTKK